MRTFPDIDPKVRSILEESRRRADTLPSGRAEPAGSEAPRRYPGSEARSSGDGGSVFADALRGDGVSIIAEVKPSSPTRDFPEVDPVEAAEAMERGGASAVSVLTEPTRFGGSLENLERVGDAVDIPVLRKDFLVDERQLHETARAGADAVLLIARFLDDLGQFVEFSLELGLEPLVEVHSNLPDSEFRTVPQGNECSNDVSEKGRDEQTASGSLEHGEELDTALETEAEVIGVNSRDLGSLELDLDRAEDLVSRIPGDRVAVAESGIREPTDLERFAEAGADAALIGTALMESGDIEEATRRFVEF